MRRLALLVFVVVGAAFMLDARGSHFPDLPPPTVSILAVGDTGRPVHWYRLQKIQRAVGLGMAAEDRRLPVNALLLLGDNFYFSGLTADSIVARVRDNVTAPYCRFVARDAARFREVEGACDPGAARPQPIPIFAVLGNHDTGNAGSEALERDGVPRFVSNWDMPQAIADVRELAGGVSLVLFDSNALRDGRGQDELTAALRRARGPWRILAAHHPIAAALGDRAADGDFERAYRGRVEAAIAGAGVGVQIFLSGHVHNLQLLETPGVPALHVVAGAGAAPVEVTGESAQRRFALGHDPGFARLDLVGAADAQRLVVSLYRTSRFAWLADGPPQLVARIGVDVAGQLHDLDASLSAQTRTPGATGATLAAR